MPILMRFYGVPIQVQYSKLGTFTVPDIVEPIGKVADVIDVGIVVIDDGKPVIDDCMLVIDEGALAGKVVIETVAVEVRPVRFAGWENLKLFCGQEITSKRKKESKKERDRQIDRYRERE